MSHATRTRLGGDSSLVKALRRDLEATPAPSVHAAYRDVLSRDSILEHAGRSRPRVLMLIGSSSIYYGESMELAARLDKARLSVVEVPGSGTWVCHEAVGDVLPVLNDFAIGLQMDGYGL